MLKTLKKWLERDQARLEGFIQGKLPLEALWGFERSARNAGFSGMLRVTRSQYGEFVLEGPKPKLEKFLLELPHAHGMAGTILKISWGQPLGKYDGFRMWIE